jgi:hypothetical protein
LAGLPDFTDAEICMLADLAKREKASADEGLRLAQARADDAEQVLRRLIEEQHARGIPIL